MKRGFTMIELIFVIVILGILAAVAIPRLAATRDDAEISKAATNLSTVVSDVTAYYTAKTEFAEKMTEMTNVSLGGNAAEARDGILQLKQKDCIKITAVPAAADNNNTAHVVIESVGSDSLCEVFKEVPAVKKMLGAKVDTIPDKEGVYPVGGSNVVY